MKSLLVRTAAALLLALGCASAAEAQVYAKLNALYAVAGVVNPQVEMRLSPHSALQSEIVFSPWKSAFGGKHMLFGILMNEYRCYIHEKTRGLYAGANVGLQVFDISKPTLKGGHFGLQNRYSKGFGVMLGLCIGYEHVFAERWVVDAFVGMSWMHSWYNGYSLDGQIDLNPKRPAWKQPKYPDPFNASAEWLPNKIGVSIGYRIFDPQKNRKRTAQQ